MRILGIDQGIASLGYCILEIKDNKKEIIEYGQLSTYPDEFEDNICERIRDIVTMLFDIVKEFKPDRICCEKLFYSAPRVGGRNKSASIVSTNIASGLIMYVCGVAEVRFVDYSPLSVKNKITGNGKADKSQVREAVIKMYPELTKEDTDFMTEHMIDAVAIATTSYIIDGEEIEEEI